MTRLRDFFRQHYWFLVVLVLFASFRFFAILLFRPGGFIADNSDYEFYYAWGFTLPMGYTTFVDLWTAYPPLFPALMLPVFELSSRIPPWVEPRLFFHVLFGLELLLFEIGNLVLVYRLAAKLTRDDTAGSGPDDAAPRDLASPPLRAVLLYALLFAPVYTLLGWFEAMPLFFLLLGLDLLLLRRRGWWIASAIAAALGFLVKLTPIILVPVAIRWFGSRLSWDAARHEWFDRHSPRNLFKPLAYTAIFAAVVVGVGLPLAHFNPRLALSSFTVNSLRPPWQSLWALIDGFYGFGLVPVDMRNLQGLAAGGQWESRLPWGLITLAFVLLYLWLYTRRYDWERVRTPVALTAVSVVWLFLYSKGWSPQFVVWILAFLVLLRPDMHGVLLGVALTALNVIESSVYLILLPDARWIMVGTVLARTALLLLIAVEWLGQIWPQPRAGQRMQRVAAQLAGAVMAAIVVGVVVGAPVAAQAYQDRRLAEHPCRAAIEQWTAEAGGVTRTIAMDDTALWSELNPWLRSAYDLAVVDGYSPEDVPAEVVKADKLAELARAGEFWWVERSSAPAGQWSQAAAQLAASPDIALIDEVTLGACKAVRVLALPNDTSVAEFTPRGADTIADEAAIHLRSTVTGDARRGVVLPLVLYWQADQPLGASYTVFTQLLDASGRVVAQQDNLPVTGLAPTDTWQPGAIVRDPYQLAIPADAPPGLYELHIGLYDAAGRLPVTLPGGTVADHLTLSVDVR